MARKRNAQGISAAQWNAAYPVGTEVRYWTGLREGDGRTGATRSEAYDAPGGHPVVFIEGCAGYVALTHVDALAAGNDRQGR